MFYPAITDLCIACVMQKFVELAYAEFLSGVDDQYQPLLADLEKKVGKL